MVFDPASQRLKCPYCGALKPFQAERETPNEYDIRFAPPLEDQAWDDQTRVARCESCKAEFVLTGETVLKTCPYCGSAAMAEEQSGPGIAPENLIPFQLTRKQAQEKFGQWLKGHIFVSRAVKKEAVRDSIAGVYQPRWTYVDDAESKYMGRTGRHYDLKIPYTVTDRDGKERTETRTEQGTRWETVSGQINERLENVMTEGSDRIPGELFDAVQPYHMSRLTRYVPEYIAGFACEKPNVDVQENWKKAQGIVDRRMAALAEREILALADEAQVQSVQTSHYDVRYKLTLLPIYLCTFMYRKKPRHVLINGQTGRVSGYAPISPLRVGAAVLIVLLLLGGLVWRFLATGGSEYMFNDLGGRLRMLL